jgi:hypothetical protein
MGSPTPRSGPVQETAEKQSQTPEELIVFQRRILLSLLVVAVSSLTARSQDATLEWKFKKDVPFYQEMSTTTDQTMKVQGTDVVQKQQQTFIFEWTPLEIKKDEVTLKQKIIGLKMSIDIGGSKINYDSSAKQEAGTNNPLEKFFQALKDAEFKITLNTEKMKVTGITGHDDFVKKLGDANPSMKPLLDRILSKEALQEMAEPMFAALPGGKKSKGNNWERTSKLDMGPIGSYTTSYTFTYDGPDKDKNEKISVKMKLEYKAPDEKAGGGLPFKIKEAKLDGKDGTGEIVYDPKTNTLKSSTLTQKLEGKLTIEIGQQSTTVDLNQTQTTKITTTDKNPVTPPK